MTDFHREWTRLAPSPTGALHLGNIRTFLVNWALARQAGWRVVLRIEDLDTPRNKTGAADGILRTLEWIGIDWDFGPVYQSADLSPYSAAMMSLARRGEAYPCQLSRSEIEAASSAPQDGGELVMPRSMRPDIRSRQFDDPGTNWRITLPDDAVRVVDDRFAGRREFDLSRTIGDFVIWTKRHQPAYQLAVVVDDARQGVTQVVRADDLLESAARQRVLYEMLGLQERVPAYYHLPLVVGDDGKRLAKRHGDTRVETYRAKGVSREAVVGLVAWLCGMTKAPRTMEPAEFASGLRLSTIPHSPMVFTQEHERWLLSR